MAKEMHVTISKVDEALFDGEAQSVTVPGIEGEMTILPEHEALISPLKAGKLTVRTSENEEVLDVESGVLEVSNNQVTVLL